MRRIIQIPMLLLLTISLLLSASLSYASPEYDTYQSFRNRFAKLVHLNTDETQTIYTDQQLAKIGVIKEYSALTQARLYLLLDKIDEAISKYETLIISRQNDGFDQTQQINRINELKNESKLIRLRIRATENLYSDLEYSNYEDIRPRYNQILTESGSELGSIQTLQNDTIIFIEGNE